MADRVLKLGIPAGSLQEAANGTKLVDMIVENMAKAMLVAADEAGEITEASKSLKLRSYAIDNEIGRFLSAVRQAT